MNKTTNKVINDDCINFLDTTNRVFDFSFADPPFNIGHDYQEYDDKISDWKYRNFTADWVWELWRRSRVMALHGPDSLCELYLYFAANFGFGKKRIAWINWHYRFGQCGRGNWIDSRCHCLIFHNPKHSSELTWNPDDVLVDSDRKAVYNDKRTEDYDRGGQRLPGTVWGVPSDGPYWGRVTGNSKERVPECPNQLPEKYLERLIRAYTNPGDLVYDPFGGSGTTSVVAKALGRNSITTDVGEKTCKRIKKRLKKGAIRV